MNQTEIKIRAAILTMRTKLRKFEIAQENEVCSSIRYEAKILCDGYRMAIADLMKLIEL